jgi:hypothetical protein
MKKKAQIGTLDLFAAISISSLLIVAIFSTYNYYNNALERKILFNDMQMTSFAAVDYLVKSPGQPYNWETGTAERIGLAKNPLVISKNKLEEFTKLEYNNQKELLSLISYDFYFKLTPEDKDPIISGEYSSDADYVVNAQRIVMYENLTAKVELRLWK